MQYESDYVECNRNLNILKDKVLEIIKVIQTFKPVKKIYIPPEIPNKHNTAENQENEEKSMKHDENNEKNNEDNPEEEAEGITEMKSRSFSQEEEEKGEDDKEQNDNKENEKEVKSKDDIDSVKFKLPVNLEIKDEIKDTDLMQCLNYIEDNINNLLMINYTINLSNVINNNQQTQRNNMVDSNTIGSKIEGEQAISGENIHSINQEINSLLGVGPQPPITYNNISVPILR